MCVGGLLSAERNEQKQGWNKLLISESKEQTVLTVHVSSEVSVRLKKEVIQRTKVSGSLG